MFFRNHETRFVVILKLSFVPFLIYSWIDLRSPLPLAPCVTSCGQTLWKNSAKNTHQSTSAITQSEAALTSIGKVEVQMS